MSSYISSFLIDPVYRQARRFSRLSTASDSSQQSFGDSNPPGPSNLNRDLSPPPSIEEDVESRQDPRALESPPFSDGRAQLAIPSPPPESDARSEEPNDELHPQPFHDPSEIRSQRARRRTTIRSDSDTSLNPSYAIPESLRSSRSATLTNPSPRDFTMSSLVEGDGFANGVPVQGLHQNRSLDHHVVASGPLPKDDGMASLRRRIHEIREQGITHEEKAHLVHSLMNEQWTHSQASLLSSLQPYSPASFGSQDRNDKPNSPTQGHSFDQRPTTPSSMSSAFDPENPYNISPSDRIPNYAPRVPIGNPHPPIGDPNHTHDSIDEEEDEPELGCHHYKRNVKLQCHTCKRWYTCRFCHDEVEDHILNRKETRNMLCMFCGCAQPAGQTCRECGETTACYYCSICKLWDNDAEKSIYHCNDCGICRVGKGIGKDFFHCKTCCACMSISIETTHRCIERSTQCDCPICGEYMFTSPETVVFMRCGHSIHNKCFFEYSKTSYRCPICSRSITNMETQFRNLDRTISGQPMPPEYQDTQALVYCNDCSAKSVVKYHWLGLKCDVCDSYNTAQIQLINNDNATAPSAGAIAAAAAAAVSAAGTSSEALPQETETLPVDEVMPAAPSLRSSISEVEASHRPPELPTTQSPTLSPYAHPQRAGRSASSLIGNYFGTQPRTTSPTPASPSAVFDDEDADSVDFWGGESPRSHNRDPQGKPDSDSDDEDVEMIEDGGEDDLEDDDDEDDDSMEIFGHR